MRRLAGAALLLVAGACAAPGTGPGAGPGSVTLDRDDAAGTLTFSIDGREALVYQYGERWALPHVWPLRAPSGNSLLVQRTEPFPHHRSLWIADRVQIAGGPDVDFYHEWKNLRDPERPELGHSCFQRHGAFSELETGAGEARATAELCWIIEEDRPVLSETRRFVLRDLGDGEYLLDLSWELRAAYGAVVFQSDWVHYAWPYLRMDPAYSGEQGGTLVDDQGRRGQEATDGQYARWVDYSNEVDGAVEGVAVLLPAGRGPCKWLTREYGTFGPRRTDGWSGTGFTLREGEALAGRVGILVHRGDAVGGRVVERYVDYCGGAD